MDGYVEISVSYIAKPIPDRHFDWCAWFSNKGETPGMPSLVGWGATEREAMADLLGKAVARRLAAS